MLAVQTLTIGRAGHVVFTVRGANHCGPADQTRTITNVGKHMHQATILDADFTIIAQCEPSFNRRGFLFDQATLQEWAQQMCNREAYASCEHLTIDLGARFLERIARQDPTCRVQELQVILSPSPYKTRMVARFVVASFDSNTKPTTRGKSTHARKHRARNVPVRDRHHGNKRRHKAHLGSPKSRRGKQRAAHVH